MRKQYAVRLATLGLAVLGSTAAYGVDYCDNEVRTVVPGSVSRGERLAPSDAVVLFDGRDLSKWTGVKGPADWEVRDGILTVRKGTGDIETRQSYQDIQLHLEWRVPRGLTGEGQHRGNSGVFLLGRYEIQILDSYQNRTYADGQAGAVYGQVAPLVNAMAPPGEWNTFDILFTAPRFNENGTLFSPARVTVLHNGVLIQNNAEIQGATGAWGRPGYYEVASSGPIRLQDHPGPGDPISFRNIWVRDLNPRASPGPSKDLNLVATKTVKELMADPALRAILVRCVPELVPNQAVVDWVGTQTLEQLKGELDITLTEEKLRLIETQLNQAASEAAKTRRSP